MTWDRFWFKREYIAPERFTILVKKNPFLELNIDLSRFDAVVRSKFSIWTNPDWVQDQYLLKYNHCGFIEPITGWGIALNKKLIEPSLGFSSAPHVHKPDFVGTYIRRSQINHIKNIISLRDTGEENYFHFYNDVLAKIFFLEEQNLDLSAYSLIISEKLYYKHYFQYLLDNTYLKNLKWHAQSPTEWISYERAVFCKPFTHTKRCFDKVIDLVKPIGALSGDRRVFLTRSANSLRFIENMQDIDPVLRRFNFEVVDTSSLGLDQQVLLFNQCRYLVAIHGAGITNIIYRSGKMLSLLEIIHPSPYIPFHYSMLCKMYNYSYDVILGAKGNYSGSGGFRIDPFSLESKLNNMIM